MLISPAVPFANIPTRPSVLLTVSLRVIFILFVILDVGNVDLLFIKNATADAVGAPEYFSSKFLLSFNEGLFPSTKIPVPLSLTSTP